MGDFIDRFKKYVLFTPSELKDLLVVFVIGAFIFSFRDWGEGNIVDFASGLRNFGTTFLVVALSYSVHILVQKSKGIMIGLKEEFNIWIIGLVISVLITFFSNGWLPVLFAGGVTSIAVARLRVGERAHKYFEVQERAEVVIWGPYSNLLLAILFKLMLYIAPTSYFLQQGLFINVVVALCTMLPIPPLDGVHILWSYQWLYVGYFVFLASMGIMLLFFGIGISLLLSVLILVAGVVYSQVNSIK